MPVRSPSRRWIQSMDWWPRGVSDLKRADFRTARKMASQLIEECEASGWEHGIGWFSWPTITVRVDVEEQP